MKKEDLEKKIKFTEKVWEALTLVADTFLLGSRFIKNYTWDTGKFLTYGWIKRLNCKKKTLYGDDEKPEYCNVSKLYENKWFVFCKYRDDELYKAIRHWYCKCKNENK